MGFLCSAEGYGAAFSDALGYGALLSYPCPSGLSKTQPKTSAHWKVHIQSKDDRKRAIGVKKKEEF